MQVRVLCGLTFLFYTILSNYQELRNMYGCLGFFGTV